MAQTLISQTARSNPSSESLDAAVDQDSSRATSSSPPSRNCQQQLVEFS
eukprot:CAMPEP_0202826868 /NCGR_PEP_ID=MMETSP1389-20130828/13895_1 /ASSEMBLY_ACC=CAM_ASM_000865 /TAXON_ID=302021 /ORGANISM="Rhodomonas sp., Strain CCMP768" /LENGTH=48 /DNA_ID= /DNA_START= /DNA_END= /DNA_ORIENTATION=